jgi:hypothetical protein
MKEKILQMVDAYWKFDNQQQPISSWHDKQDLKKALEELLQPDVIKSVCECPFGTETIPIYTGEMICKCCGNPKQTVL